MRAVHLWGPAVRSLGLRSCPFWVWFTVFCFHFFPQFSFFFFCVVVPKNRTKCGSYFKACCLGLGRLDLFSARHCCCGRLWLLSVSSICLYGCQDLVAQATTHTLTHEHTHTIKNNRRRINSTTITSHLCWQKDIAWFLFLSVTAPEQDFECIPKQI